MPIFGGVAEKCILCEKKVYQAERVATTTGNVYHKSCFRCTKCNKMLEPGTAREDSITHRIFCSTHYAELASAAPDPNVKALTLAAKKVELEEAAEEIVEGSNVWLELAPSVLQAQPSLKPKEGSEECFSRAKVLTVDADRCKVRTESGVEVKTDRKLVYKMDAGRAQANNLMLVELNEPSLLQNLRARFDEQKPYTYTGELELMCLNPYEKLKCYDESVMQQCRDGTYPEPHTWAVSERIFKALTDKGTVAQSVVVSGESGAGKTETNKHVMAYLRWRAAGGDAGKGSSKAAKISSIIGQSNVLLEALGNARTTNNKNSSRFGKYLELAFSSSGGSHAICGARFKTYLLEKSRVTHQATNERNFHCFYYLLASADEAQRKRLRLKGASGHAYTAATPVEKAELDGLKRENAELDAVMKSDLVSGPQARAYVGEAGREALSTILAALLHLGDVTFEPHDERSTPDAAGKVALESAAALLQYPAAELLLNLTQRWIAAGPGEEICIPLPPTEARQVRDAVCKSLYQRLFMYHVHLLNNALSPAALGESVAATPAAPMRRGSLNKSLEDVGAHEKVVGLLDVFGFESLAANGLEQICINLANEKLHNLFLGAVFQGIPPSQLKVLLGGDAGRIDNGACLKMLGEPPSGILHLLDFQCKAPKASDQAFCLAVNQTHGHSQFLRTPKVSKAAGVDADQNSGFFVRHFAGDVLYTAGNFLQLNNDSMNHKGWLESGVGNKVVNHLFTAPELQPAAPAKKGFISVGQKFTTDLAELVSTLTSTDISFIRCMKSNLKMQPRLFEPAVVRQKVRAAGTLSALKFVRKLMPGTLKMATLVRLAAKPHVDKLPKPLQAIKPADKRRFAAELMSVLGVPADQVRYEGDDVHVTTALVPFLAAMEEKGEAADAAAADAVATMAAEVVQRTEAQRRKKEQVAVASKAEEVKMEISRLTLENAVRGKRKPSSRSSLGMSGRKESATTNGGGGTPRNGSRQPSSLATIASQKVADESKSKTVQLGTAGVVAKDAVKLEQRISGGAGSAARAQKKTGGTVDMGAFASPVPPKKASSQTVVDPAKLPSPTAAAVASAAPAGGAAALTSSEAEELALLRADKDDLLQMNARLKREIMQLEVKLSVAQSGMDTGLTSCAKCGANLLPKFCGECGTGVPSPEKAQRSTESSQSADGTRRRRRRTHQGSSAASAVPAAVQEAP